MPAEFVHLHVHTQYSLLDGAVKVKDLVKRVAAGQMSAVAVTDHGNMFGAITFYKAAKDAGVRAILGCELDVEGRGGHGHHLPLLAETTEGYKNLVKLASRAQVEGTPLKLEDLAKHARGVVAMTGCMGGVVAQAVLEEGEARGREVLGKLLEVYGRRALYVELQDHGLSEQSVLNGILVNLARELDLPVVATNDVHYAERADAEAHLYLSCIKTGRSLEEARERHHGSNEMYLKSAAEMAQLFVATPEAVRATLEIAERCALSLKLGDAMLPNFHVPAGYDAESYFRHVARQGLGTRFSEFEAQGKTVDRDGYMRRLEAELDVITKMHFAGYFLIVWDFIRQAKETGIPVGPGRGSGAGSIVAYAMRITDLDPIPYNLLFERFLNPERVSMPDFDIDFCMDRRDEVIAYVQRKYGESSVGQIATFAELKSKSVVKDVARCMGIAPSEAQQIANLIPRKTPAETYTIAESLEVEPKLKSLYERDARVKELLDQARKLEGLTRHAGKHAAGIVISEGPLWDHVPVFRDDKTGALVTQYYKDDVEQAGLVKFDFLGLKTLTVLDVAVRLANARPDVERTRRKVDLSRIPLDDGPTYKLLASGETKGVFQLESSGMQQLFKELRPDGFEDIVAAVALYRPGPLGSGMVEDFVNRKLGRAPIASLHPLVDDILAPTYGVIVYQEQVMQIAQKLAGYTLGGADLLRRAMGKKKPEEMAKQKSSFLEGARNRGVDEKQAEHIFGLLEYFAGYGFNKSHSAAYALVTYQTAWLKAHYPVELLCAILTSDKDRIEKVVRTIADARAMGVTVLPPDVNESDTDFKVVYTHPKGDRPARRGEKVGDALGPQIRFGLGAVRGLGGAALEAIFEARRDGPFRDLFDLAARVDAKRVNKAVFEALVQCGAFDSSFQASGVSRARAFASVDIALERSRAASRDRAAGQTTLFGLFDAAPQRSFSGPIGPTFDAPIQSDSSAARNDLVQSNQAAGDYAQCEPWDRRELLVRERQALGFYVSGHPLERYIRGDGGLTKLGAGRIADCAGLEDWAQVKLVGMVEGYRERIFKDATAKVAFFDLEDLTGRVGVKLRAREIERYAPVLTAGEPVLVTGKVSFPQRAEDAEEDGDASREPTILLSEALPLTEAVRADTRSIAIRVRADQTGTGDLASLARLLSVTKGGCPVALCVSFASGAEAVLTLGEAWRVDVGDALLSGIERIFGEQVAELRG